MFTGLLSDCVPPIQTTVAVCAGYGAGGYAAASRLVWISGHSYPISDLKGRVIEFKRCYMPGLRLLSLPGE